jgi:diacylglycerol kinase
MPNQKWSKTKSSEQRIQHAKNGCRVCWQAASFRIALAWTTFALAVYASLGTVTVVRSAILCTLFVLAFCVEMLNTAIELGVDRISLEWHALARDAKDVAASASFLAYFAAFTMCGVFVVF